MKVLMLRHNLHQLVLDQADEVYAVLDRSAGCRALPPETLRRFAGVYRVSSYDSLEELSAVAGDLLTRGTGIDRVVSFAEFTQYAAGYLAHLLGLEHFSPILALATRDKRVTKALAARAGLPVARWFSIPDITDAPDPSVIEEAVGFPLVLKPAGGWGTLSTVKVHGRAELADVLAGYTTEAELVTRQALVEEFIDGEEFHVDAVWRDGTPWIFHISRYLSPRLHAWTRHTPHGSVLLAERDHPELHEQVRQLHLRLNKALGLERGATHLEVFREHGTGRLLVSEIASRVGGANISDIVAARQGVHGGVVALHELLDGDLSALPFTEGSFASVGGLWLVPERSGRIAALPSRAELLAHPNVIDAAVYRQPGDTVEVTHPSAWCVMMVVGADSEAELLKAVDELMSTYRVEMA